MEHLAKFGLSVLPMVHVAALAPAITFYEAIGGELAFGSRDGDFAQITFGDTNLNLLAHPGGPDNPEPVELHFTSAAPLERIAEHLREIAPKMIYRGLGDEAFGRMLQLRTDDGLVVKLLELERNLIE